MGLTISVAWAITEILVDELTEPHHIAASIAVLAERIVTEEKVLGR